MHEASPNPPPKEIEVSLESLPEEIRTEIHEKLGASSASENVKIVGVQRTMRSAPLPAPEEIREYELICPGALDRLIKLQEKKLKLAEKDLDIQSGAIQKSLFCKELEINHAAQSEKRGQWMGLCVSILIMGAIIFAIFQKCGAGTIACLAAIFGGGLATVFFANKTSAPSKTNDSETTSEKKE
ncbi:hypothetical protein FAI40_04435 [Acetobacteraceae bacterium]|nr:hypothetical protein FAI40_04435 [Acetobacteraceae bacterium]